MRLSPRTPLASLVTVVFLGLVTAPLASADAQQPAQTAQPVAPPAPSGLTPAPADQAAAVVAKVQDFYDRTTSFSSDFQQEYWVKQYNVKKQSHGHVVFSKPGRMDWVYDTPAGNRVVSDGHTLRVYEAANKQMFEQPVNASQYPAALSFLTGGGKLADVLDFQMFAGAQMSFPGGWVLVGTPKTVTTAYQKVFFYVDQQTSQVRRALILDMQGNHNRFDFVNPVVNIPVSPGEFSFTPPPGTTVVHP
jgi:outer membrane lipoprotein carrier protein